MCSSDLSFLMNQWIERIKQCFDIEDSEIGFVQQDRCEYVGKKIVLIMVQSLLARDYPKSLFTSFGTICFDEVHRFGAVEFRKAVTMFPARYRMGITATPQRTDGLEKVFFWHIGDIAVVGSKRALKPRIEFVDTKVQMTQLDRRNMTDYTGNMNLSKVTNFLTQYTNRNRLIVDLLINALKAGRKILVLSSRRGHLDDLYSLVKQAMLRENLRFSMGYYVGGMDEISRKVSATKSLKIGRASCRERV